MTKKTATRSPADSKPGSTPDLVEVIETLAQTGGEDFTSPHRKPSVDSGAGTRSSRLLPLRSRSGTSRRTPGIPRNPESLGGAAKQDSYVRMEVGRNPSTPWHCLSDRERQRRRCPPRRRRKPSGPARTPEVTRQRQGRPGALQSGREPERPEGRAGVVCETWRQHPAQLCLQEPVPFHRRRSRCSRQMRTAATVQRLHSTPFCHRTYSRPWRTTRTKTSAQPPPDILSMPATVLTKLARDKSESVRASVARNPSSPLAVLEMLAKDNSATVRRCVTWNEACVRGIAAHPRLGSG